MPIFPGPVRHNNDNDYILDLTKNQVIGSGIFADIDERDGLHTNMQTPGFMATVLDLSTTYIFTGPTWTNPNHWSSIGGSGLPSGGLVDDILTTTGVNTVAWKHTLNTRTLTVKNHDTNPGNSEIIFSKKDTGSGGYTVDGDLLGEIRTEGFSDDGTLRTGGSGIKFKAGNDAPDSYFQTSSIQFIVSGSSAAFTGLEVSSDREIVLSEATDTQIPEPAFGGFYYNSTQDSYFVGKNN